MTSPVRQRYLDIKKRCYHVNNRDYPSYGGRGVAMCARWFESFDNFLKDTGIPQKGMTLDRIDNSGGYWCGNCPECKDNDRVKNWRWATRREQAHNRRTSNPNFPVGVSRAGNRYRSQIWLDGTTKYLGLFSTEREALEAYQNALTEHLERVSVDPERNETK